MAASKDDSDRNHREDISNPFVAFRRFADVQMASLVNTVFGAFQTSPMRRQQAIEEYEAWLKKCREGQDKESASSGPIYSEGWPEYSDLEPLREKPFDWWFLEHHPYSPLHLERREDFRKHGYKWRNAFEDLIYATEGYPMPAHKVLNKERPLSSQYTTWDSDMTRLMNRLRDDNIAKHFANTFPPCVRDEPAKSSYEARTEDRTASNEPEEDHEDEDTDEEPTCQFLAECDQLENPFARMHCRAMWAKALALSMRQAGDEDEDEDEDLDEQDEQEMENEELEMTELDLYTRQPSSASSTLIAQRSSSSSDGDDSKPSVLSTLTTTETRTLPDGSKTTKVVLKKRFADGVEECTERVYTENAPSTGSIANSASSKTLEKSKDKEKGNEGKPVGKKGWFWT